MCMHLKHMNMCCECWSPVLLSLTSLFFVLFFLPDLKTIVFQLLLECYLLCYKKRERSQLGYPHVLFTTLLQDCTTPWIPSFVNMYLKRRFFSFSLFFCLLSCSLHRVSLWTDPPISEFNGYLCKCCSHCCEWIEVKLLEKMLMNTGADDEWHSTADGVIQKWAPLKTSWL